MKNKRYVLSFIILGMLLLFFLALNLCAGSVQVPLRAVLDILGGREADGTFTDIIMEIRFPRALAAAVLGGALALSGYLLQTFFQNPIENMTSGRIDKKAYTLYYKGNPGIFLFNFFLQIFL